jgi:hypothetical protein
MKPTQRFQGVMYHQLTNYVNETLLQEEAKEKDEKVK